MLILEANGAPSVHVTADGELVVLLRTAHPLTEELLDAAAFRLTPHYALCLSERLKQASAKMLNAGGRKLAKGARIVKLSGES